MNDNASFLFTSESVSEGHPDKICDQISDAILDSFLAADPASRVGLETLCTKDHVILAGEVRGPRELDRPALAEIARETIHDIGYDSPGFDWRTVNVTVLVHNQSPDIARGVDAGERASEGAGDQGMMFGFACDETPQLMPAPIYYAHRILEGLARARKAGATPGLRPDAKSQVTVAYENGRPARTETVVVSVHHDEALSRGDVRELVQPIVAEALPGNWCDGWMRLLVNPTGRFTVGGPESDTGLTGRKIIVDTYGGSAPHGGGAFSGKDPTKVDRSAAYAARYLAKNVVAAGLARACTIQVAYAIGVPEPVSLLVRTEGGDGLDASRLSRVLRELVDLTPRGIIRHLRLDRPIYRPTGAYGHFGRELGADGAFSWERLDLVDELRRTFS
jgi:S-adenosylmethionine synthetase